MTTVVGNNLVDTGQLCRVPGSAAAVVPLTESEINPSRGTAADRTALLSAPEDYIHLAADCLQRQDADGAERAIRSGRDLFPCHLGLLQRHLPLLCFQGLQIEAAAAYADLVKAGVVLSKPNEALTNQLLEAAGPHTEKLLYLAQQYVRGELDNKYDLLFLLKYSAKLANLPQCQRVCEKIVQAEIVLEDRDKVAEFPYLLRRLTAAGAFDEIWKQITPQLPAEPALKQAAALTALIDPDSGAPLLCKILEETPSTYRSIPKRLLRTFAGVRDVYLALSAAEMLAARDQTLGDRLDRILALCAAGGDQNNVNRVLVLLQKEEHQPAEESAVKAFRALVRHHDLGNARRVLDLYPAQHEMIPKLAAVPLSLHCRGLEIEHVWAVYKRVLSQGQGLPARINRGYATVFSKTGKIDEALAVLASMSQQQQVISIDTLKNIFDFLSLRTQAEEAAKVVSQFPLYFPPTHAACLKWVREYMERENYREGVAWFTPLLDKLPRESLPRVAELYRKDREYQKAIELCDRAIGEPTIDPGTFAYAQVVRLHSIQVNDPARFVAEQSQVRISDSHPLWIRLTCLRLFGGVVPENRQARENIRTKLGAALKSERAESSLRDINNALGWLGLYEQNMLHPAQV